MSSDKKSGSHSQKPRKKSPASVIIHHESLEISQNGDLVSNLHTHQEPMKSRSCVTDDVLNAGIMQQQQRHRLSSGSVDGEVHPGNPGLANARRLSRTQSESGVHTKTVAFMLPENDEVFSDISSSSSDMLSPMSGEMASLHRPISIEEELFTKVNQLNSLVLLWRKRWRQQKDCTDSLVHQIQYTKQECATMIDNMKEVYSEKVKSLNKDLNREVKDKQKLEHEKQEIVHRLNKTIEETDSERKSLENSLLKKDEEVVVGLSKQEEARTTIRVIKKELSKVKRENEKLVRHIAKLRNQISVLEEERKLSTLSTENLNCNGQCEHKILFELAIERVRFYDELMNDRKLKGEGGRHMVKSNPDDPLNTSVESTLQQLTGEDVLNDTKSSGSSSSSQDAKLPVVNVSSEVQNGHSQELGKSVNFNNNYYSQTDQDLLQLTEKSLGILNGHGDILTHSSPRPCNDTQTEFPDVNTPQDSLNTSTTSDSAISGDGDLLTPHLPLRKSVTLDAVTPRKSTSLERSKTWVGSHSDGSGKYNLPVNRHDTDGYLDGHHHNVYITSPRLVRSGFEGLRERRNGITDTKIDAGLQLKLAKPRKSHEFGDLLKKLSFHTGHSDTIYKDPNVLNHQHGNKRSGFMNLGVSVLSRKKSNSLKDV